MSEVKYRINLGNCENALTGDLLSETVIDETIRFDSTKHYFDSTIITFDNAQ